MASIIKNDGNWYKGNLHIHTTCSDGRFSPDAARKLYREAGYDFIALTDHWRQSENQSADGFLELSGCEWDTGNMIDYPVFHIVGVGMASPVSLKRSPSLHPQEIINAILSAGGLPILAHPAWSITNPSDCLNLEGLCGVEIYNTISNLPWNGRRADSGLYFDIWANQGKLFQCIASDDCHFYNGDQTRSFIMVKARELSAGSLKKALQAGDFYASQGPLFHSVDYNGGVVEVRCSEVETVVFYSNTVWCDDRVVTGGVDFASYKIKPTDKYVRVELIDREGNMAWSSPFYVNI